MASRAASVSAGDVDSAAATKRAIIRARLVAASAGSRGPTASAVTVTSPAVIARAASDAVQPESTSVRIVTRTPMFAVSYRR